MAQKVKLPAVLDATHLERARQALALLVNASEISNKAKQCGYDCRAHDAAIQAHKERLEAILHHFR